MTLDLALIWALLIAFAILAYVVLDGFDLGVGILFPFIDGTRNRDTAMNSVAPVWDGNETWLVLGGGGLFAVFPLAYAIILPALYAPVIAMLLGLVLRGVAFEFRWKTERGKFLWDWAFAGGSLVAALAQGIMLGAMIQGIKVEGRAYAGGWFDWLTPFSLLTGLALVVGYALLGATWLIWKTEGDVQSRAYGFAWVLTLALLFADRHRQPVDAVPQPADSWRAGSPGRPLLYVAPVPAADACRCMAADARAFTIAGRLSRSWRRSRCSCCATSASASASIPTSCRRASRSGMRRRRIRASPSCWSARLS